MARMKLSDVPGAVAAAPLHARIAKGNNKLGAIWNYSGVPCQDCPGSTAMCRKWCYGRQRFAFSPAVKFRWSMNSKTARSDLAIWKHDIISQIYEAQCSLFRIHVAGDFFSQEYLQAWCEVCARFPDVRFLAFTKSFKLDYSGRPENLNIMWSVFPDSALSDVPDGPRTYTLCDELGITYPASETERINAAAECSGLCETCGLCFHSNENDIDVKFHLHGNAINGLNRK